MIEPTEAAITPRSSVVADLRAIASDLVEFRELLVELTIRDIRIRYK